MEWADFSRPGYAGKKRDEKYLEYNKKFGEGNWRILWKWNNELLSFVNACQLYEDGYYHDSFKREGLWKELINSAKDVYDYGESDVESGLDYTFQKGNATHLQDISIRRVAMRRGWEFKGDKLIQIRPLNTYWGEKLSPGKVLFHIPELIFNPHLIGWWDYDSIEDFWQSNKILQVKSWLME